MQLGQPSPAILLNCVAKSFAGRTSRTSEVLRDISFAVEPGAFVAIVGPSGCGKTTLLRLVNGLLPPDRGQVEVLGTAPRPGQGMAFVFLSFRLLPWASVRRNVEFALRMQGVDPDERRRCADQYLDLVGLRRVAEAFPGQLSGGMKQRVALARALATEPDVLLMDEPFASIDAQARELMQIELLRLWSERRSTILFVTHSIDEAVLLADRVLVIGGRPATIVDSVDIPLPRPRDSIGTRSAGEFTRLRNEIWSRVRDLVASDPSSDFFGRLG